MSAVCILDTSIFVEILNLPFMADSHGQIVQALTQKINDNESLFLPMATIFETGNHIANNGDGTLRRQCADSFVSQLQKALAGESPFKPISFIKINELQQWLAEFPDSAMTGRGLGDLSIIHDWQRLCRQNTGRRVYIWSLDGHLDCYDQPARI